MPGTASTLENNVSTKKNNPSNSLKKYRLRGFVWHRDKQRIFELHSGRTSKHLGDKDAITGEFIGC